MSARNPVVLVKGCRSAGSVPALLLDALGTLVALEPPAPALRRRLAERFAIEITPAQASRAIAAEIAYYRAHLDEGRDPVSLAILRRRCAEALRAALPASDRLGTLAGEQLTDALLASIRFTAFPDARPALLAARSRGQRVVVASNWDISLHRVLAQLSLTPLVAGVVTSAEVGARKPAPAVFERALHVARVSPRDAIHIGDSLEEDVAGARNAGVEPILIRRDGGPGAPGVRTIASLLELGA